MSAPQNGFLLRPYEAPVTDGEAEAIMRLLHMYGPHYKDQFAPDMRQRFRSAGLIGASAVRVGPGETMGSSSVPWEHAEVVSHTCIIYDSNPSGLDIGLFGAVITHPEYRKKGLSAPVVASVLADWDRRGGGYLILGTGSPHAARTYEKEGFVQIAGGLDSGQKGYNPDDVGEMIMLRPPSYTLPLTLGTQPSFASSSLPKFDIAALRSSYYYTTASNHDRFEFVVETLDRCHWAGLVLLFNVEGEANRTKLTGGGITDGVYAEEQLVRLINEAMALDPLRRPLVCMERRNRRVCGITLAPGVAGTREYVVGGSGRLQALEVLRSAASSRWGFSKL